MTEKRARGRRRFAHQILGLIAVSALLSLILFLFLSNMASVVAETYCFNHDIFMTEFDWIEVDRWIFGGSTVISVCFFSLLFLALLGERLAYIRKLTAGINALQTEQTAHPVPLEGNNELTELAAAINDMSAARQQIRERELLLSREKDQLIRTLSHDIRTPLTSILAYSEYLAAKNELPAGEREAHLQMIRRKAEQIRDLTDILLDGGKRSPERFDNARLLMEQLAQTFEGELEDRFSIRTDLSGCPPFEGVFDVQELRRIFDNLISNAGKYADPEQPVSLSVSMEGRDLVIRQTNSVLAAPEQAESYGLGLNSIRRIAQHYGGRVTTAQNGGFFAITVLLSDF